MNEPAVYLFVALLGSILGVLSRRLPPSGLVAFALSLVPSAALAAVIGRS